MKQIMSNSQQYCTTKTAARRLGVRPQRVRELAATGRLRGRRDGTRWEFDLAEIERLAALPRELRWKRCTADIATPGGLHPKASAIYSYIIRFKREHAGESPTTREIAAALGLSSTSVVQYHLEYLEAAGLIERPAGKSRMISIPGAQWRFEETNRVMGEPDARLVDEE